VAANRWDARPWPYPDPEPGTKARRIDVPVDPPDPPPGPWAATRRDGTECDIRRTLPGLRDPAAIPAEDRVRDWRPV
jgi:hypothetical protein